MTPVVYLNNTDQDTAYASSDFGQRKQKPPKRKVKSLLEDSSSDSDGQRKPSKRVRALLDSTEKSIKELQEEMTDRELLKHLKRMRTTNN